MSYPADQQSRGARSPWLLLAWLSATVIAVFLALQVNSASVHEGVYHPVGNDAFYHARRSIDTAGERGFYEFDDTIHVPEGSQITWPWAYDYLLGQALSAHLALNPDAEPMRFLAMIPPVAGPPATGEQRRGRAHTLVQCRVGVVVVLLDACRARQEA